MSFVTTAPAGIASSVSSNGPTMESLANTLAKHTPGLHSKKTGYLPRATKACIIVLHVCKSAGTLYSSVLGSWNTNWLSDLGSQQHKPQQLSSHAQCLLDEHSKIQAIIFLCTSLCRRDMTGLGAA